MGCSDCNSKGGCDTRKGTQRELLDAAVARVYVRGDAGGPTWGLLDDEARFGAGVSRGEARRLSRSLAAVAKAPVFFRHGEPEDLCDFAWVLCLGRRPSLLELREGSPLEEGVDLLPGVRLEERWLRVAFSSVARMAAMQEVALSLEVGEGGAALLHESPRPGVFDPQLLKRVRSIVALLEASDVAHVDFGLLDRPLSGASPGDYAARYGAEPMLANFLFMAAPSSAPVTSALALQRPAAARAGSPPAGSARAGAP